MFSHGLCFPYREHVYSPPISVSLKASSWSTKVVFSWERASWAEMQWWYQQRAVSYPQGLEKTRSAAVSIPERNTKSRKPQIESKANRIFAFLWRDLVKVLCFFLSKLFRLNKLKDCSESSIFHLSLIILWFPTFAGQRSLYFALSMPGYSDSLAQGFQQSCFFIFKIDFFICKAEGELELPFIGSRSKRPPQLGLVKLEPRAWDSICSSPMVGWSQAP